MHLESSIEVGRKGERKKGGKEEEET